LGDKIENTANIFFDYNTPVRTNTVENSILIPLQVQNIGKNNELEIYPNPVKDYVCFQKDEVNQGILSIFDANGKQVLTKTTFDKNECLHLMNLADGYYSVRWEENLSKKVYGGRFILAK
jgi:hypothetical protein